MTYLFSKLPRRRPDTRMPAADPIDHPDIARMSHAELDDLPLPRPERPLR